MTGAADHSAACDACLRRTDLIAALAGWLDVEWRRRDAPGRVLALPDSHLLALGDAAARRRFHAFDPAGARAAIAAAGLTAVCRHSPRYPSALEDLPDPPALLHVAGRLAALEAPARVGIVGARAASAYGREVACELGRSLAMAGVGVVSGLALGIDAAAHDGAIAARPSPGARAGAPVAVLAGGADRPYPARGHRLHAAVWEAGAVVSEMPPGFGVYRWAFVARNRIIAALSHVLVVVEAAERSGSLTTADFAGAIGRTVAAVPGRVTARTATGTNGLIHDGAPLVRDARDVVDLLAGATGGGPAIVIAPEPARPHDLAPDLAAVLERIEQGEGSLAELASTPAEARTVLLALGRLEAAGLIRRGFGGRYERAAASPVRPVDPLGEDPFGDELESLGGRERGGVDEDADPSGREVPT
jgi:DNA processing protein